MLVSFGLASQHAERINGFVDLLFHNRDQTNLSYNQFSFLLVARPQIGTIQKILNKA